MTETCIVPNCNSGREISDKPIAYFNVPEDMELRSKWIKAIPETCIPLISTDVICEKHFFESDIIRHYVVQDAAGNVVQKVAYDYPRLAVTAVPSIFPGFPLAPNAREIQNVPQSTSQQTATDICLPTGSYSTRSVTQTVLYDYMLLDMASDVGAHVIAGGADMISKVAHLSLSHKENAPEVVSHVAENNISENHPLVATDTSYNVSSPTANGITGDSLNHTATSPGVLQSDVAPITAEPTSIFAQPDSTLLSDNKITNGAPDDDGDCCDCDDGCCDCNDCDCGGCDCGDCDCVLS